MVARSGIVASAPALAASRAAWIAAPASAPPSSAARAADAAGTSASSIVFSPVVDLPSVPTPVTAASSAATIAAAPDAGSANPATAPDARRNAVPYSGPDAPPTVLISVRPTTRRSSAVAAWSVTAGSGAVRASSAATTALNPRSMLIPWSPSPMA